jgi:hypothetical protein
VEASLSTAIFYVEKELGAHVTEDYLLLKMFNQIDEIKSHYERERKECDRIKRR